MKLIAEEWAVSEKNQHKTRRKSRFLSPDGKLILPSLSASNVSIAGATSFSASLSALPAADSKNKPPREDFP
jgi:hypothetical protein